jgi:predicted nucleotidyltransferase component of viral defense system
MQLKAFIRKKSQEYKISAQIVMQNYMMERLLERLSLSQYRKNFIIKGGFLIAAIIGLDNRGTMDLDVTAKGVSITRESIGEVFENICKVEADDDVAFTIARITDIREGDDYPGLRIHLSAVYSPLNIPLTVDVTTGDRITPEEIEYPFKLLFEERSISIMAYNLETILAEKLETILSRNVANTRPRDFYDVHILYMLRGSGCDYAVLRSALEETVKKRSSLDVLPQYEKILDDIRNSSTMREFWGKYQRDFDYVSTISFDDVCDTVLQVMSMSNHRPPAKPGA